ncbi:MAG: mechanosensitive ion channel, partial [Bdellovibrionales bacterium]|nr:mechanosensitive ion channel [Bdellovibrionales bacterium]
MSQLMSVIDLFWKFLTTPFFELGGNKVSIITLAASCAIILLALYLARFLEKLAIKTLENKDIDSGIKNAIPKFVRYLIVTIGVLMSLDTLGVSLKSLAAVGAVFMVGIGFGLQNISQNFIAGLIILLERPVKVGDIIKMGDVSGRVIDIKARSTVILTRDDVAIIVPNSKFISEEVINETHSGKKVRLRINISVAYGSDVPKVQESLISVATKHEKVIQGSKPKVIFKDFGDSSLDFSLLVWIEDIWNDDFI